MRGFFGGLMIGVVTVAILIVALSLLSPGLQSPEVSDGAPRSAPASGEDPQGTTTGLAKTGSDGDLVELPPTAPGLQKGEQDNLGALASADRAPAEMPRVGGATAGLVDPAAAPAAPGVDVKSDSPVAPVIPSGAPSSPDAESDPSALTNPAQPSVPSATEPGSGFGSGADPADTAPRIASTSDPARTETTTGVGSVASAPGAETAPAPSTQPAAAPVSQAETNPSATETEPDDVRKVPVPQVGQAAPVEPVSPGQPDTPSDPQIAALPQSGGADGDTGPSIGKRVVPLTERNRAVEPTEPAEPVAQADPAVTVPTGPAIKAHAAPFENPEDRPLMAIVLIDDPDSLGGEALAEFPYPLTFAISPTDPDAAAKMARYRADGFEVVVMIDLHNEASAKDAEVNLSVWMETLPHAVALMEGTDTGVQGSRELSDQVTEIANSTGMGLIFQSKGLNTAHKMAARDDVPAGLVFRDFDGAGQTATVMRRFLDQAAFRAGQQGGVIMLGRLRPDTISALLLWGLQDRASRVTLVPVSAVLDQE